MRAAGHVEGCTLFCLVGGEVTGWCSRNRALSLKPTLLLGGGLSSPEELRDNALCIPRGGTRTLPQGCTIVSWLLLPCVCIPSLSWLADVWICPLELRESPGGWKKPISYKRETNEEREGREVNTERIFSWEGPTGLCFISGSGSLKKDPSIRPTSSWNRSSSRSNTELSLFSWCSLQWQMLRTFLVTLPRNWKTLTQAVPLSSSCQELRCRGDRMQFLKIRSPSLFFPWGFPGSSAGKKSACTAGKWKWSHSVVSDSLRPVDCSPPSSSVHGILQARILEWGAISFSRGSSRPRDRTQVSHIAGRHFNLCTTREALFPIKCIENLNELFL